MSELQQQFAESGHLVLRGFADPVLCQRMWADVVELARQHPLGTFDPVVVVPEQNLLAGRQLDELAPEEAVSKVFKLHRQAGFHDFAVDERLTAVLAELIGSPDIDCFSSQFIFKNPGAWGQPWHQDSLYFKFDPPRPVIAVWLAITEATTANGCLHVLPGSHLEPVHEHVPDRRPNANVGYAEIVDHDMGRSTPMLMEPGDVLLFDSHAMHRSTDNSTDGPRAAMVYHYARAGTVDTTPSITNDWMPARRA